MNEELTHWLANPNKNFLGHFDLPGGNPVILTIESAKWEKVENPKLKTADVKRVIRFQEKHNWIKPFICNEINAENILKSTKEFYMEKCSGKKIKIYIGKTLMSKKKGSPREEIDCLRVKDTPQEELDDTPIDESQLKEIQALMKDANVDIGTYCQVMQVVSVEKTPKIEFINVVERLKSKANENN
jgi:hypothetical protein